MEFSSQKKSEEKPRDLWEEVNVNRYQVKAIIFTIHNYNII